MSEFLPDPKPQERESAKGPEAYLSPDERKALQRSLSFPEDLPPKFKSWLIDFIAVNLPQIPISQIVGTTTLSDSILSTIAASIQKVAADVSTTSGSYVSLSGGPSLTGLGKGEYLIFSGASIRRSDFSYPSTMSYSVNGAAALDADKISAAADVYISASSIAKKTLPLASNTIEAKYKVAGGLGGNFADRYICALRIGK